MSDEGRVRWERDGRVLKITIDNPAKKNAFSPEMMQQLSQALTELDRADELWAGVVCAEGDHFVPDGAQRLPCAFRRRSAGAPRDGPAGGESHGVHGSRAGATDGGKLHGAIFQQGVEHAPGECTMRAAALQCEVEELHAKR